MNYKDLTEQLVKTCLYRGADGAEVFIDSGHNLGIQVRNGEIETVEDASFRNVSFKVLVKNSMAFSSCNDFSDKALEDTISHAINFAKQTTPDENNVLPDDKEMSKVEELYDPQIHQIPMEKKIDLVKTVEELAMKDSRITKSAGSQYGETEGEIFLANSNGISKGYSFTSCYLGVSVVAEKGDQKSSGGEWCSRRFFADLKTPKEIAEKAAKEAVEMLDPRMVETQKAAVIFDPDVAGALLGGIIGAINGERVLQGASFLAKRMGEKIASELVTIIDDGTLPKGLGSKPFDGEGVPTQRRIVVDKGVLKNFLYNTVVAKRAGVESTGNALKGGGISVHNFYMAKGEDTPEQIIKATKKGLLLKSLTGYGINSVSGHFSGGASGFWIEKGKLMFPVKGLTIAAAAEEMLNGIDRVASDLDLNRSLTAPTIRVKEMQIGGK